MRICSLMFLFFFSSRRRHTRSKRDWSSDVCSSDLRLVGEAEVEDRLHHAGHGGARARTDGDEERTLRVAEFQSAGGLELDEVLRHLLPEPLGRPTARPVVVRPSLRRNREAGRHRNAEVGHLRELASLSTQQVTHEGGALGLARPEKVDVLGHRPKKSFKTTGWNALPSIFLTPSPLGNPPATA